jgi:hypothetical protein
MREPRLEYAPAVDALSRKRAILCTDLCNTYIAFLRCIPHAGYCLSSSHQSDLVIPAQAGMVSALRGERGTEPRG